MVFSRRDFLSTAVIGAVSLGMEAEERNQPNSNKTERPAAGKRPIMVSAANGFDYMEEAYAFLKNGGDTLDAALKVVKARKTIRMKIASGLADCRTKKA